MIGSEIFTRFRGADEKLDILSRLPLFASLTRAELRALAANLDTAEVPAGTTLITQGHVNTAFWILLSGEAEVLVDGERRRLVTAGGYVGAVSMLDGHPGPATVVTTTPVRAMVASTAQFRALEANDTVALRLMAAAIARLRGDLAPSLS